jgi:hypothetical protein
LQAVFWIMMCEFSLCFHGQLSLLTVQLVGCTSKVTKRKKLHLGNKDHSSETAEPIGEGHGHVLMPEHRTPPAAYCPGMRRRQAPAPATAKTTSTRAGHDPAARMVVCPCTAPRKGWVFRGVLGSVSGTKRCRSHSAAVAHAVPRN